MSKIERDLELLARDVCEPMGIYVYETEYKREGQDNYLRLYIDREGGVNIEDCENVSRLIDPQLDALDPIGEAYIFEVSSPGLDRKLSRDWHFEKVIGHDVELKLFAPFEGSKMLEGNLLGYDHGLITLKRGEETLRIEKGKVAVARLAVKL
ncbi:MAG: ribosome maturation factor RimP [Clostridia bacterium]|nr:ribosome maturation factor RimP [Clostridia bacterium]